MALNVEPMVAAVEGDTSREVGVGAPGEGVGVRVKGDVIVGTAVSVAATTETVEEKVGESTALPVFLPLPPPPPNTPKEGLEGRESVGERVSAALGVKLEVGVLKGASGVGVGTRAVLEEVEVAAAASAGVGVATPVVLLEKVGARIVMEAVEEGVRVLISTHPPPPLVPVTVIGGVGETWEVNVDVKGGERVAEAVVVGSGGVPEGVPVFKPLPFPVAVVWEVREEVGVPPTTTTPGVTETPPL